MTLSVHPYRRNSKGDIEWLSVPSDFSDMAGTENTRWSFWSSSTLKQLGLSLVTTLGQCDIYAEDQDLLTLKQEIERLMTAMSSLCEVNPEIDPDYWRFRLSNVLAAVQVAQACQGGVYIG
ncbi:MAG: hypothetical protein AAFQ63_05075 [Cyanobacteria bacterium J06621_11]